MTSGSDSFPPNPTNGQFFELAPGQVYEYTTLSRSWQRIIRPILPLATPISDGLMAATDYRKLTGILIPQPQSTLSAPGCSVVDSGFIGLKGDNYLSVTVSPDNITPNTGLVEFNLNYTALVQDLIDLGRVRFVITPGDQGDQGDQGDPGLNNLPVGPYGPDGNPGANAPWPGALVQDNIAVKADNRAIVDIAAKRVSPTENYLVLTRANLGNPSACPNTILPIDKQSPWLLCISPGGVVTTKVTNSNGKLICSSACNSTLYYLNAETIVSSIRTQLVAYLNNQKALKEAYVQQKLDQMSAIFEEQKQAIGCALEGVKSETRNVQARQYLEQSKIQAAQADATKPGYDLDINPIPPDGSNPQAFTPSWGVAGVTYDSITLKDPEKPIVDPDGLESGPLKG